MKECHLDKYYYKYDSTEKKKKGIAVIVMQTLMLSQPSSAVI